MVNNLIVRSLGYIKQTNNRVGEAIDDLLKGHNNVAAQLATNPNGGDVVPAQVSQLQVQHIGSGAIDLAITDPSPISRAINYYVEYSQSASFSNSYTHVMGPSRNSHSLVLPNGIWYFQARSQYPAGGPASGPVAAKTSVAVTGSSSATLFPSQGSGTGGGGAGSSVSR